MSLLRAFRNGACAALLALGLAGTAGAQPATASPPPPRPVAPQQVSPSAWFVQGDAALGSPANRNVISNAAFVVTPAGVVVIDALGSPQLARELLAEIARITPQPVTHVVVTHYHADHIYGLQEFRRRGARIVAHRGALEYLNSETASARLAASRVELAPWIDAQTKLVPPDLLLDGPTELVVGGVNAAAAGRPRTHARGPGRVPAVGAGAVRRGPGVPRPRALRRPGRQPHWIAALDTLLKMDAGVVVPGHGARSSSARADLQLTRDYLAYLRETMGAAARDMDPFEEAYARTDWSRFEHLPLFRVANRMNAYNTYLLMERQLQ